MVGVLAALGVYGWLAVYPVGADEQAAVLRLGRYHRTLDPGLGWVLPGLERVEKRRVTLTHEEEFGFRTVAPEKSGVSQYEDRPAEKSMLSGDQNVVSVEFVLQYRIADLRRYLFGVADPERMVRDVAQAAMREAVAKRPIDDVLTAAKGPIEDEARARIQELLDAYGAGIEAQGVQLQDVDPPEPVRDAFSEVANAEQDRERLILEAQGYADQIVPRARGEAQEELARARAYEQERTLRARGESDRFLALLVEYRRAPQVTRQRLYIETLEQVLPGMEKIIVDEKNTERILPYLPLGRGGERP